MSDKALTKFLKQYDVFQPTEQGKLKCTLTGHEVPHRLEDLKSYVETKKFVSEYGVKKVLDQYGDYFDFLGNNLYGCKLTLKTIARKGKDLEHHIQGQKFINALKRDQEKKAKEAEEKAKEEAEAEESKSNEENEGEQEEMEVEEPKPKKKAETPKAGQKRKIVVKRKSGKTPKKA